MVLAAPQGSSVSNVGRVAPVKADPAVETVSLALRPMTHQSTFSSLSTCAGRLIINVAYAAGKQADAAAQAAALAMRERLVAAAHAR